MALKRYYFDVYDVPAEKLRSEDWMLQLLTGLQNCLAIEIADYREILCVEQVPAADTGISVVGIGLSSHITCHSFDKRGAIFIDCCLDTKYEHGDLITKIIRQLEPRARVESCYCDLTNGGRFGKQLVLKLPKCLVVEAANIIHNVMMTIEMHPLCEVLSYGRSQDYTILQPIMESHIAAHQNGDCMELDIFSCRTFSEEIIMQLLPEAKVIARVERGRYYPL
jgi:S-adenosylmethionine/arginine decarboxylase-like enzyme